MRQFHTFMPGLLLVLSFAAAGAHAQDTGRTTALPQSQLLPERMTAAPNSFSVIGYHEVRHDVRDYPDPFAVDTAALVAQFSWLNGNGYKPVSLDEIIASRQPGGKVLPAKAVLLTFDDGYLSFYTRVYPLLREFRFPAVLAVVGKWIDNPTGTQSVYGEKDSVPDASFPSWGQLREMAASGLVEIASHTYDLHRGVLANPQGNLQAAATTRTYDAITGTRESDESWRTRVREDLARNSQAIERGTGHRPRAIAWPYGSYNGELLGMAGELGMPVALTLEEGTNGPEVPLTAVRRILVAHNPPLADFTYAVRGPPYADPVRAVQLSLDAVYDADPVLQERNLSVLLERMLVLKPTYVFLQASTDVNGDGMADAAYFPTRHLPLRADLFNRVAWQLASRDDIQVFAVLPVTGFRLTADQIRDIYEDLGRHASFQGLLFMQDTAPKSAAEEAAGTARFMASTQRLADATRRWRGPVKIARGLAPDSPDTDTLGISTLAAGSDYVVIALPADHGGASIAPEIPGQGGITHATRPPATGAKLIYMLHPGAMADQSGERIARQMRALQLSGALNFGYHDDFMHNRPPLARIAPFMSLRIHPR